MGRQALDMPPRRSGGEDLSAGFVHGRVTGAEQEMRLASCRPWSKLMRAVRLAGEP